MNFRVCALGLAIVTAAAFAGCQGPEVPKVVAGTLVNTRAEMIQARQSMEVTGKSLDELRKSDSGSLKASFDKYSANLKSMEAEVSGVKSAVTSQESTAEEFFSSWEKDIRAMQTSELKEKGEARREESMKAYDEVQTKFATLRKSFQPYMANLRDTRKFLANDLTPNALNSAKPTMDKALKQQEQVMKDLDEVVAAINRITPK